MATSRLLRTSSTSLLILLISTFLTTLVSAQSTSPTTTPTTLPTTSPQPTAIAPSAYLGTTSATSDNLIYYHGGQLNTPITQYSSELFSLDVTKSWSISAPAWTNLTVTSGVLGPIAYGHSATMSKDQKTLYVTAPTNNKSSPFFYEYSIESATWSTASAPAAQADSWAMRREAQLLTDPVTGAIWYLGGSSLGKAETNEIDKLLDGAWNINLPTQAEPASSEAKLYVMKGFSSGTAHIYQNKIYLFGGSTSTPEGQFSYQSFQSIPTIDTSTKPLTYGQQLTLGDFPKPRRNHCSVLTASKKIIIYGGIDDNSKYTFDDMWSLDLITMTWQQIVVMSAPRYSHTCNVVGANMIVFGGKLSATVGYKDMQVLDIMTWSWMQTYTPKKDITPVSQPLPVPIGGASKRGLSSGSIIGIVVGVLAVVLVIGGLVFYRQRQKKIELHEAEIEKAAYLASLSSEDDGATRRASQRYYKNNPYSQSSPHRSPSTRRLNGAGTSALNSPTIGYGSGFESLESPTPVGASNVQYLMQHLPDGTIAVQPVYLDHQSIPLQHSPNMMYSENSSLGGYVAPNNVVQGSGVGEGTGGASPRQGYVTPPPSAPSAAHVSSTSGVTDYYGQPAVTQSKHVPNEEQPSSSSTAKDPFASPVLVRAVPHSSPRQTRRQ
ncbi:hypothetical protein CPB97_008749 [Podila verticillata]|nr:hypothetical protein CPB97_008749 [Podila verticillata]